MQEMVDRLGVCLTVVWVPDESKSVKGELKDGFLYVYDQEQAEAFATLSHEIVEFKLKSLTKVYRCMINSLIDGYEKLAYKEKEEFIEFIPRINEAMKSQTSDTAGGARQKQENPSKKLVSRTLT